VDRVPQQARQKCASAILGLSEVWAFEARGRRGGRLHPLISEVHRRDLRRSARGTHSHVSDAAAPWTTTPASAGRRLGEAAPVRKLAASQSPHSRGSRPLSAAGRGARRIGAWSCCILTRDHLCHGQRHALVSVAGRLSCACAAAGESPLSDRRVPQGEPATTTGVPGPAATSSRRGSAIGSSTS
jgi:hypothetical protein